MSRWLSLIEMSAPFSSTYFTDCFHTCASYCWDSNGGHDGKQTQLQGYLAHKKERPPWTLQ